MIEDPATPPPPAGSPPLEIPAGIVDAMIDHCRREDPLECCGILGGMPPRVSSIHPLRNTDESPVRYNADPRDVIAAIVALRERGAEMVAIYHSHPRYVAVPSQTDLRENYYGDMPRIIVSLLGPDPDVRMWRLEPDSYEELPWHRVPEAPELAVERKAATG